MQELDKNDLPQPEYDKAGNLLLRTKNHVANLKILRRILNFGSTLKIWEVVHKSRKYSDRFPVLRGIFSSKKQEIIEISRKTLSQISEELSSMIFGSEKGDSMPPEEDLETADDLDLADPDYEEDLFRPGKPKNLQTEED